MQKMLHSQAFKDLLKAAPTTLCWHVSPWHLSYPHQTQVSCLWHLIQRLLALLSFGVKQVQQLPALCGEWLLEQLGGIPWHQH